MRREGVRTGLRVAGVTTGASALLAGSMRAFGPRSARFAFVVVALPLVWFALLWRALELQRPVLRLPSTVRVLRPVELDGLVYERVGVRVFKRLLRRGPLSMFGPPMRLPAEPAPATVADLDRRMQQAEAVHEILLVGTLAAAINAAVRGWWGAAGWILLFNVLGNGYPAMLQRYNRVLLVKRFGAPPQLT